MVKILKILANGVFVTAGIVATISIFLVGFKKGYDAGLTSQISVNNKVSSTTAPTPT
jgi:hypothetical protein